MKLGNSLMEFTVQCWAEPCPSLASFLGRVSCTTLDIQETISIHVFIDWLANF